MEGISKADYKKGLSQIAVFTSRGAEFFVKVRPQLEIKEVCADIHEHTFPDTRTQQRLLEMLQDKGITLQEIIRAYKARLSMRKRIRLEMEHYVSLNRHVYNFIRRWYKRMLKTRR